MEIARTGTIDLAILDIQMPVMNGVEAIGGIKAVDECIQVLILTGHAKIESLRQTIVDKGS